MNGLSERLLMSHYENNYGGALRRLNAIRARLAALDWADTPVFEINGLKREELIATGSVILHEIYFDSLGGDGDNPPTGLAQPPAGLAQALERDFGSVMAWRTEFTAMAKALGGGSGWTILAWFENGSTQPGEPTPATVEWCSARSWSCSTILLKASWPGRKSRSTSTWPAVRRSSMIPGGFKGLRLLHEHRLIRSLNISLEERENAISEYVRQKGARAGVPNLLLAHLWRDDEFYLKVLAGRDDVLTPAQVVAIRQLAAEGKDERLIFEIVGARNVEQVKRVLTGKTYRRVL
jgi:hypothetical protein